MSNITILKQLATHGGGVGLLSTKSKVETPREERFGFDFKL